MYVRLSFTSIYNQFIINSFTLLREARNVMGEDALVPLALQMGGEDFAILAENAPAVFGFLGIRNEAKGSTSPHHSPDFRVDEDVLHWGVGIYAQFALDFLK